MTNLSMEAHEDSGFDLACAGEAMVMFVPDPPRRLSGQSRYRPTVAGAESNVASFAAALGLSVAWVSRVGADIFGDYLLQHLAASRVDTSAVERDESRPTGVAFKQITPSGTKVAYYRSGSAAAHMGSETAAAIQTTRSRMLHMSGITPALSSPCEALIREVVRSRPAQTLLSFDVNWRPALWHGSDPGVLLEVARASDVVFVGQDEAAALWSVDSAVGIRRLLPQPELLVVKQGAAGATAFSGAEQVTVPSLKINVVEAVGAGDAFAAGYLVAARRGLPLKARLRLGVLVAASALRVASDVGPLPSEEVIESLLCLSDEDWQSAELHSAVVR